MPPRFRIIAHRGASAHAPENTLAAFERAIALGAEEIELDVRLSSDGEILVFHDDRLDAKTKLEGRVRHYDARVLERTDLLPWFLARERSDVERRLEGVLDADAADDPDRETCIPRLDTVLARFGGRVRYHIEIKGWDDLLPLGVLRSVDAHGLRERVTLTSFSQRPLVEIRKLDPKLPITFLLRDAADALRSSEFRPELEGRTLRDVHAYWIEQAAKSGFQWVGIRARDLSPEAVESARALGLAIRCWGVRTEEDLRRAVALGAIGATVDWPGHALALGQGARAGASV
ncbi:MAG: glycerophosphodiester phosphodiesterase family protein [Myxococcota bacterium]